MQARQQDPARAILAPVKLRPRIALVSCLAALASVAVTGTLLLAQSRADAAGELRSRMQLLAQNRAFALSDALAVATRELTRLSQMAELDLGDNDLRPEATLLAHAHRNSTLFNIGLQIEDAQGRCLWSEPAQPGCPGRSFADEPWFQEGRRARGPVIFAQKDAPSILNLVVPIGGGQGVLRGIIDVRSDRIVAPAIADGLPPGTEVALVSSRGRVLQRLRDPEAPGWQRALAAARTGSANAFEADGFLYAHAPVTHANWGLVFRWPIASLDEGLQRQRALLVRILAGGALLAVLLGFASSRALTRPLDALVLAVRGLGRSEPASVASALDGARARSDELGELARAFIDLQERLGRRDAQHQEDLARIRELAASLEERVHARTAELEAAQRSLLVQERLAAMGQAAAVISHELKNSLGALGMGVDLIEGQAGAQGLSHVHAQVRAEIQRLRSMTDELLVFARTPRLERRPEDLHALLGRALDLCRERADAHDVKLRFEPGLAAPTVSCDAERLQSVAVNLIQNAIEAVAFEDGSEAAAREVVVSTERAEHGVVLAVEDSGPGVSPEMRAHLFEPFATTKRNGTGLGLATAQRFVAAHGGRIELQQGRLRGARFAVVLVQ